METYDENDVDIIEEDIVADFVCNNCDTPAARKISGTAGHSADIHPCPWCHCLLLDVNRPEGYNINGMYFHRVLIDPLTKNRCQHLHPKTTTTCLNRNFTTKMPQPSIKRTLSPTTAFDFQPSTTFPDGNRHARLPWTLCIPFSSVR